MLGCARWHDDGRRGILHDPGIIGCNLIRLDYLDQTNRLLPKFQHNVLRSRTIPKPSFTSTTTLSRSRHKGFTAHKRRQSDFARMILVTLLVKSYHTSRVFCNKRLLFKLLQTVSYHPTKSHLTQSSEYHLGLVELYQRVKRIQSKGRPWDSNSELPAFLVSELFEPTPGDYDITEAGRQAEGCRVYIGTPQGAGSERTLVEAGA